MTTEIIPYESQSAPPMLFGTDDPDQIVAVAKKRADVLASVIKEKGLYATISGREHVLVEGWTLLGSLMGVFPVLAWTRPIENGWEARVEAKTLGGATVGAAEAQCTRSERTWAQRDDFALRSMAQTRATGKALRLPLGFVMQLAGYNPTPAEEMPADTVIQPQRPASQVKPLNRQAAEQRTAEWAAAPVTDDAPPWQFEDIPPPFDDEEPPPPPTAGDVPMCGLCHSEVWDNRRSIQETPGRSRWPHFKCKNCGAAVWPNKDGTYSEWKLSTPGGSTR